ncbi:ATP-dependent Lhr-like helicase [Agromyces flavus]|uniref:ATP dependent helicase, Lhr family n=1 Tax=Agromyces flavus TaxID=589382 RepID=A0A1H1SY67_9MICO|nr:ATP-dependent helicase [Agromyces flavus]MCP2369276.1 ATP-dependent Lhr-like helicase [Agromyces flavus]GGI48750.1 ATP-dependent DNA helicase [Agromyces flavus]SDS52666.1 ATP dependent helicase, Lhr family [Agromyces flavus]
MTGALDSFAPATRAWFTESFRDPTPVQDAAWRAISQGDHALVVAPTGSGKTLAAFLSAIDRLHHGPTPIVDAATGEVVEATTPRATRVVYLSPLKALGVDVERNLRAPLVGIGRTAAALGVEVPEVTVGVRSGDTSSTDRRALVKRPPDILITTPESLFLMLTSQARETLAGVETVIVDEIHALAGTKRGAHLALSLERLDELTATPVQRIGLSATVRPHEEVARFLSGTRPVTIVAPPSGKRFDLTVTVPVDDLADLSGEPGGSVWPHVEEAILDEVLAHQSTIVFANSRRLAERLTARLNELWAERTAPDDGGGDGDGAELVAAAAVDAVARRPANAAASAAGSPPLAVRRPPAELAGASGITAGAEPIIARSHHGSVSKEERALVEADLKAGRLKCVVATSSLELGIDMGAVDLVMQVESPPSVASGLQRIGRAGHQVGEVSKGVLFPKHRADLLHSAVVAERMIAGGIEPMRIPTNPLDVLAQQTVAAAAIDEWDVEHWFDVVRRAAPFHTLPRSAFDATLDLLAGRYPSDRFGELRPRLVWDRDAGTITGRRGAQRLAVTSGGTIPDRGLFGVFMIGEAGPGRRVGELDEEMVYESRVGDVFALGATSWRIQEITHDRVLVSPAVGEPGRLPFWKGDGIGRPAELGEAIGGFIGELAGAEPSAALERCEAAGLDERAGANLVRFIADQRDATRIVPDAVNLVVERFRDELGDWRIVLHSPYGMRVHAPWALAVDARVQERFGIESHAVASDDGIVLRLPDTADEPPGSELFEFDPAELAQLATERVGDSALFASRFRECAARALLLPRQNPGKRSPLWQQRQKASQLLEVARDFPDFPIVLEAVRECLQDVYDLPALTAIAERIRARRVRFVDVTTETASPFAASLLFGYVGAFMYEGDAPLAERRAAALSLDPGLLAELLGTVELRELLDPGIVDETERMLQRTHPDRRAKGDEGVADLLRELGPLTLAEVGERVDEQTDPAAAVDALVAARRAARVRFAASEWIVAVEDVSRLRDALGVPVPPGLPEAFGEAVRDPLGDLVGRYARTHGPFTTHAVAERFGIGVAVAHGALGRLAGERRLVEGAFLPHGSGAEWCDPEVLRRLRRRSLAALREEVEPVAPREFARFLPDWQHVGGRLRGVDGVAAVIEQLEGVRIPASAWESFVLPARVGDYRPDLLDELTASGEVVWVGQGSLSGDDGWVSLHLADTAKLTMPAPVDQPLDAMETELLTALGGGGAYFFRQLVDAVGATDDAPVLEALWRLAWAGLVTNDTFAPVRGLLLGGGAHKTKAATPRARLRGRSLSRRALAASVTADGARATRAVPPRAAGRWSILPVPSDAATPRAHALGETLLERYGVVTRGSVVAEDILGGFALAYRTLAGFEETGRVRRGYFIDGQGGAQFGTSAAVDRLRQAPAGGAVALAATDPANPFGGALEWPEPTAELGHRPARKAGALVAIVDGEAVFYLERGGRTALVFTDDDEALAAGATALAESLARARGARFRVESVNGGGVYGSVLELPLRAAGFRETPQGLRFDART